MSSTSSTSSLPVDTTSLKPSEPSICIPRVFKNITQERVKAILDRLDLGDIERIDMVQRTNEKGEEFQRVFIHFKEWFSECANGGENARAIEVRQRLLKGIEVKVVYDDPWFWKLSASKVARPEDRKQHPRRPAPFLDLSHTDRAPSIQTRTDRGYNGQKQPGAKKAPKVQKQQPQYRANASRGGPRTPSPTRNALPTPSPTTPLVMAPVSPTSVKVLRKKKGKGSSPPAQVVVAEAGIGAISQKMINTDGTQAVCSVDVTREMKIACAAREIEYRRVELASGCSHSDGEGNDEQDDRFNEIDFGARLGREAGEP
jgi:hypothetical protein